MDLSNRAYIITGASGGLGTLIAEELAERGAHLLLSCRDPSKLTALVQSYDGQIQVFRGDLTEESSLTDFLHGMSTFANEIRNQGKSLYGLVNAIGTPARVAPGTSVKEFGRIRDNSFEVNYDIPEKVANYFAELAQPNEATVLFFSSQHRLNKPNDKVAYWLPKRKLERFAFMLDIRNPNLKVNMILPGALGMGMSAGKRAEYEKEGTLVDEKVIIAECLRYLTNPPEKGERVLIAAQGGATHITDLRTRKSLDGLR